MTGSGVRAGFMMCTFNPGLLFNCYNQYVAGTTALYLRAYYNPGSPALHQFQFAPFNNPASFTGISKKALGFAWPRVAGRKPVLA